VDRCMLRRVLEDHITRVCGADWLPEMSFLSSHPLCLYHLVLDISIIYIQKNLEPFSFLFRACSGYTLHTASGSFLALSSTRENGR
jgi:hypothetical protein